jgi:hypothetical protein
MNNFSKVWQNEKYFNLCQNGKGTMVYWWERFLLCFVMQAKAHYTCQLKVDEVNDLLVGLSSTKRNIIKTTYMI